MLKRIPVIVALTVSVHPMAAHAQVRSLMSGVGKGCTVSGNCTFTDLMMVVINVSEWILAIAGIAALLFLILGGANLLISGGSEQVVSRGKKMITGSVIGLVVILTAWIFVNLAIVAVTGRADATIFDGSNWFQATGR